MNAVTGRAKILHTCIRPRTLFGPWDAFQRGHEQVSRKYIQEHSRVKATGRKVHTTPALQNLCLLFYQRSYCVLEGCICTWISTHVTPNALFVTLAAVRKELLISVWLKAIDQDLYYGSYFHLKKHRNDSISSSVKKWYGFWSVYHCIECVFCHRTKKEKVIVGFVYLPDDSTQQAATNCKQLNYYICCCFKGRGWEGCGGMRKFFPEVSATITDLKGSYRSGR